MMTARANWRAVNGRTLARCAPSRTCRCQSSGLRIRKELVMGQQLYRVSHAKSGDLGGHVAEASVAVAGSQIDVNPGHFRRDETVQKPRGEDVVALAVRRALQDVRDCGFQVAVVVLVHWKRPYALAAGAAGG